LKENFATEQWRHEHAHELSEDMTERQQIEKTYGMKQTLPFQMAIDFSLERCQICNEITVSNDNTFRFGRRRM
jgi:hypothetical protein